MNTRDTHIYTNTLAIILTSLLTLLTACDNLKLPQLKPKTKTQLPTVALTNAKATRTTKYAARIVITLTLTNPNPDPLPLTVVDYNIELPNLKPYHATTIPNATIPANSQQTITLPAVVTGPIHKLKKSTFTASGSIQYTPPNKIHTLLNDLGTPHAAVAFNLQGTITLNPANNTTNNQLQ